MTKIILHLLHFQEKHHLHAVFLILHDQRTIWSYLLICDKHLNQKDAEEDECGTANIVFEHW